MAMITAVPKPSSGALVMDENIAKLLKEKQELAARIRQIDEFVRLYGVLFPGGSLKISPSSTGATPAVAPKTSVIPRQKRAKTGEIAAAAETAIQAAGRPLNRAEIVERLEAAGIELNSNDKPRYIGTILWRNQPRFIYLEGRGYAVQGVPGYAENEPGTSGRPIGSEPESKNLF
jgi:hypothetical protein